MLIHKSATPHTVCLFELSVSFERNIEQAHTRKKNRYAYLEQDIKDAGYNCLNIPFEVGSRGHLTQSNRCNLSTMHKLATPKTSLTISSRWSPKSVCYVPTLCTNLPHPRPSCTISSRWSPKSVYYVSTLSTCLEMTEGGLTYHLSVLTSDICKTMYQLCEFVRAYFWHWDLQDYSGYHVPIVVWS